MTSFFSSSIKNSSSNSSSYSLRSSSFIGLSGFSTPSSVSGNNVADIYKSSAPSTGCNPIISLASFLVIIPSRTADVTFSYIFLLLSDNAGIESISNSSLSLSSNIGTNHSFRSEDSFLKCGMIVSSYKASLASATFAYVCASGTPTN